jgi:uncharacterized phage protein (TIGR01671 family)
MRDIKFRAWCKDTNKWIGCMLMIDRTVEPNITHITATRPNVEITQYTGLKDKNGKEIYEGDILQTSYGTYKITIDGYHGIRAMWGQDNMCLAYALEGKVIGNIYENPELGTE